jgi:hypothetical protein
VRVLVATAVQIGLEKFLQACTTTVVFGAQEMPKPKPFVPTPKPPLVIISGVHSTVGTPPNFPLLLFYDCEIKGPWGFHESVTHLQPTICVGIKGLLALLCL